VSRSASDLLDIDAGIADLDGWVLVEVGGRDRERFLASQLTSDVVGLATGDSQLSALLDRSGRLQGFFYVRRRADALDLLVPEGAAAPCVDELDSRVIADDVTFRTVDVPAMRLILGPAASAAAAAFDGESVMPIQGWGTRGVVTWSDEPLDVPRIEPAELEARRVLGGPPSWGVEARPGQLINETALIDSAVSFDKGCYLGQETVAKIASHRGAVRGPVLLELDGAAEEAEARVGSRFGVGERARAGGVLSAARWDGRSWLYASLHRELRLPGRRLSCRFADGGELEGVVHAFPLLAVPSPEEIAERLTVAASTAFSGERTDRALELADRAIAICPTFADAYESKGVILGRLERYEEAIATMHRLLEVDPTAKMAHTNLSLYYNKLGDIEAAERHLALATRAEFAAAGSAGGGDAAGTREAELEADRARREAMFSRVLEIDPDDALAQFGLGELELERGRPAEAVEHLERAVAADPAHSAALLALGRAFEGVGDGDRARRTYERGIDSAAKRGDLATAQKIQERLNGLAAR